MMLANVINVKWNAWSTMIVAVVDEFIRVQIDQSQLNVRRIIDYDWSISYSLIHY